MPQQMQLQSLATAQVHENGEISKEQALPDGNNHQISPFPVSQSVSNQLANQRHEKTPYDTQNTIKKAARQNRAHRWKLHSETHPPKTGNIPVQQQRMKDNNTPTSLQQDRIRNPSPKDFRQSKTSMNDGISSEKVIGSRVVKSFRTSKNVESRRGLTSSISGKGGGGALMRVFINNRLGAKAEVICSPSATVGDFKKIAARNLGTGAEAIRLKRQGQRALRDAITLEDYEIGNGCCLDYEIDT